MLLCVKSAFSSPCSKLWLNNWEFFAEHLLLVNWKESRSHFQYYADTYTTEIIVTRKTEKPNYENNQQVALYRLIYYSKSALHVSGDVFAHHQEHLTVFTVSGSVHPRCCRLLSCMRDASWQQLSSLTFVTTRGWSVSQPVPLQDSTSSILECHLLSINMWSVWLWVFQSGEVQVYLRGFRCRKIVL